MRMWLVSVPRCGYDEYDSAVVVAADAEDAVAVCGKLFDPRQGAPTATELTAANEGRGIVLSSFNAG